MPTYEYLCKNCGKHFERVQRISDKSISKCPDCNGKVKRLITGGSGTIFRGGGWPTKEFKRGK